MDLSPSDNLKAEEHLKAAEKKGLDKWSTERAEVNDKRFKFIEDRIEAMSLDIHWLKEEALKKAHVEVENISSTLTIKNIKNNLKKGALTLKRLNKQLKGYIKE